MNAYYICVKCFFYISTNYLVAYAYPQIANKFRELLLKLTAAKLKDNTSTQIFKCAYMYIHMSNG